MIHLSQRPLSDPRAKQIHEWLKDPACRAFIEWVANQGAAKTAEVGNALVSDEMGNDVDAKNVAEEARKYLAVHDLLTGVLLGKIKLTETDLKPKPLSHDEPDER